MEVDPDSEAQTSANAELVHRLVDAFNGRDPNAFNGLITDDFEWVTPTATTQEPSTYRGLGGVRQFFEDAKVWTKLELRVDEIRELGDLTLVLGELSWFVRREETLAMTGPLSAVARFQDGKIKRIDTYRSRSAALAAVGLE